MQFDFIHRREHLACTGVETPQAARRPARFASQRPTCTNVTWHQSAVVAVQVGEALGRVEDGGVAVAGDLLKKE